MRLARSSASYTLKLKNGTLLRHQSPLILAQFRADIRLEGFWPEADGLLGQPSVQPPEV
jgi:hypothetical protein